MTVFEVSTTSRFDREMKRLSSQQPRLVSLFADILPVLENDPYNHTRSHPIKKLTGVPAGDGQYRIRSGRFRFRFDIVGKTVYLKSCSLRREDTY